MSLERLVLNVKTGEGIGEKGRRFDVQVHVLSHCCYVWLGEGPGGASMNNMALSLQTRYDEMPLTRILVPAADAEHIPSILNPRVVADDYATALSARLAKRLQMQVFVSVNMKVDISDDDELLKCLVQALAQHITSKSQ